MIRRLQWALAAMLICLPLLAWGPVAAGGTMEMAADGASDAGVWRIGYSARLLFEISRADAKAALDILSRELAREARYSPGVRAIIYEDMPSLAAAVRNQEVDMVALTILDYMKYRDRLPLEPALYGKKGGNALDEMVLVVRRDRGFDQIGKLGTKRLMFMAGGGELASLWLDTLLARHGLPPADRFFGQMQEAGNAHKTLLPVFFKQADACVLNRNAFVTAAELNPQVGREMEVLAVSPPFPFAISCFRSNLEKGKKTSFLSTYARILTTPAGRQICTLFRIDGIERPQQKFLEDLEALMREHAALKGIARKN